MQATIEDVTRLHEALFGVSLQPVGPSALRDTGRLVLVFQRPEGAHSVVLTGRSAEGFRVFDPAHRIASLSEAEVLALLESGEGVLLR